MEKETVKNTLKKILWTVLILLVVVDLLVLVLGHFKYFKNIKPAQTFFEGEKLTLMFFPEDIKDVVDDFEKYDKDYMTYSTYKPRSQKYKDFVDNAHGSVTFAVVSGDGGKK